MFYHASVNARHFWAHSPCAGDARSPRCRPGSGAVTGSPERVTWLGHATTLLEVGGARVLTDPLLRDRLGHLRRQVGAGVNRVYFAGDTDIFDGMRYIAPGLDVALLPVWGWGPSIGEGHMDPRAAAEAAAVLHPRAAVPIHWATYYPAGMARVRPAQ